MDRDRLATMLAPLALDDGRGDLFVMLVRRLAEGRPVGILELAEALSWSESRVRETIAAVPAIEHDANGDVVGAGISLRPTPHVFEVEGRRLYTWCALDTLLFPSVIGRTAHVQSPCKETGRPIRLVVDPSAIVALDPADAVISIANDDSEGCDVRRAFCNHVHFFSSPEAARNWSRAHAAGVVLSVPDAFELARSLGERLVRAPLDAKCC